MGKVVFIFIVSFDQEYYTVGLWHKVDISTFHCWRKSVNFCNNVVGLAIADNLKCKIWKIKP